MTLVLAAENSEVPRQKITGGKLGKEHEGKLRAVLGLGPSGSHDDERGIVIGDACGGGVSRRRDLDLTDLRPGSLPGGMPSNHAYHAGRAASGPQHGAGELCGGFARCFRGCFTPL